MKIRKYLVIRANGDARITTRPPNRLSLDEFAYRLNISIPDAWASIVGDIDIGVPDPEVTPTVSVEAER